jgi:hypothetical protein
LTHCENLGFAAGISVHSWSISPVQSAVPTWNAEIAVMHLPVLLPSGVLMNSTSYVLAGLPHG